jgi:nitrite reductase/ring-hydroxylating ferredoxin subunit/uncharacterized membrane protein
MSENPIVSSIESQEWLQPLQDQGSQLVRKAFQAAGPSGAAAKNALHGVWLGHPLHPAITDVPVGSWTVAATLDALEMFGASEYRAGADAAVAIGLLGAVPAALSGMTDWSETHGKPQRVGAMHGILNMGAAALYAGSYVARKSKQRALGRLLSFAGFGLVIASAYLGGELSYSQKIGVNHAPDPEQELPQDYTPVIGENDLVEGKPAHATVDGTDIFLLKQAGRIYAMAGHCSHLGGPLWEGKVEGDTVVCPWHGSRFCLNDGAVIDGPATNLQPVLDVVVRDGQVLVKAQQN